MPPHSNFNPPPPGIGIRCTASDSYEHIIYPHYHTNYELFIIISGHHSLILDRETIDLYPGNLVLLRSEELHSRKMISPGKYINVAFPSSDFDAMMQYFSDVLPPHILLGPHVPIVKLTAAEIDTYARRIERINLFCISNEIRARGELRALLSDLCFYHFADSDAAFSSHPPWFAKLLLEMEKPENIRQGLSAMLNLISYTHEHLCREFKRMMNCTPTEYVNHARLELARQMLLNPQQKIVDICYTVGFESISYFYSLFKAKFGSSPSRYRKNQFALQPGVPPEQFRLQKE